MNGERRGALDTMVALLQHAPSQRSYDDLTDAEVEQIGRTLDALREDVLADRGARDAAYIRRVIAVQRCLEVGGRLVLLGSRRSTCSTRSSSSTASRRTTSTSARC